MVEASGVSEETLRPALRMLVALPALDEERTVGDVVSRVPPLIPGVAEIDVLVIDDGSRDATAQVSERAGARVLRHAGRRGVGGAFHSALREAIERDYDLLVTIDADGQFDPEDIPALVAAVVRDEADFATASRFVDPSLTPTMPPAKLWGNRQMSRLISRLTRHRFHDVSCGMRCYNRRAMLNLHLLGGFTYTQEVILNLAFKGLRLIEVPIRVQGERSFGESRVASDLLRYAIRSSAIILRAYRDYRAMEFFGWIAAALIAPGLLLEVLFLGHYLATGSFSPHKWAGLSGATLILLGLMMFMMGVVGDMMNRHRIYLEELLYEKRRSVVREAREAARLETTGR